MVKQIVAHFTTFFTDPNKKVLFYYGNWWIRVHNLYRTFFLLPLISMFICMCRRIYIYMYPSRKKSSNIEFSNTFFPLENFINFYYSDFNIFLSIIKFWYDFGNLPYPTPAHHSLPSHPALFVIFYIWQIYHENWYHVAYYFGECHNMKMKNQCWAGFFILLACCFTVRCWVKCYYIP